MLKCAHCGHENLEGEIICVECGTPLNREGREGTTRRLEPEEEDISAPRWGTARLGLERKLLLHVRGYSQPLIVSLTDELVIGRYNTETGQWPDIDLGGYGAQEYGVSRLHAAFKLEDDAVKVIDLGSSNSTHLNGQKLIPNQARILRDGDELRLGRLVLRVNFA